MRTTSRKWFLSILFLAVILRIGAAFYLGEELTGEQQKRVQDQVSYDALARSILAGKGYTFPEEWYPFTPANTPTAHWSFVYPIFLAGVYGLVGFHPLVARIVQAVICGLISVWLLFRIGKSMFGERVGLVAAFLGAVYAYFVYHDAALMTEPFYILCILASFDIALELGRVQHINKDKPLSYVPRWALLGLVIGVGALLRQTILIWTPFLLFWIIWNMAQSKDGIRLKKYPDFLLGLTTCLIIIFFLIIPWTIRNTIVYQTLLPLNSNMGYTLYSANHPYHKTQFDQDYAAPLPADLYYQGLNEAQLNSALSLRAYEIIKADPVRYLLLSLDRISIFFNFWFSPESNLSSNLMRVLSFGLYLPLFIFGLVLARSRLRKVLVFYLFVVVYSFIHILSWASIRYRLPIDAALMPFAGLAVVWLWDHTVEKWVFHKGR